jgi:O-antigen ligase
LQAHASNSPRASLWEWTLTALLAANLAWTTLCLGGYRAETMVITTALTGALLAVHLVHAGVSGRALRTLHPAGLWLLPFLAYAAINVLMVSPVRWLGWMDWSRWVQAAAVFWVAVDGIRGSRPRQTLFFVLVLLGVAGVLLGCYQRFVQPEWLMLGRVQAAQFFGRASGSFGIPNSLAAWLILLLPVTGALAWRPRVGAVARVWWIWVTLVLGFGLLLTLSRGAWIALALALAVWPLTHSRWKWRQRAGVALAAVVALGGLGAIIAATSPQASERLGRLIADAGERSRPILWRAAWNLFREHPIAGSGAGSYNVLFERHRPAGFLDEPQWAHNEYLNTASDYGGLGCVLLLGAVAGIALRRPRSASRSHADPTAIDAPAVRSALNVGLLAFALQLGVDFHLKIPALALAFAVVAALRLSSTTGEKRDRSARDSQPSRWLWFGSGVAAAILSIAGTVLYRSEALRERTRDALDTFAMELRLTGDTAQRLLQSEATLRDAVRLFPVHAHAWSDLAFAIQLQAFATPARAAELGRESEAAARRALELSAVVTEFWIRLGVALDLQGRAQEARAAFVRSTELAPRHPHTWYYYAHHLAADRTQQAAAREAIANCLALDPANRAAAALRETLIARR